MHILPTSTYLRFRLGHIRKTNATIRRSIENRQWTKPTTTDEPILIRKVHWKHFFFFNEQTTERFLRVATDLVVEACLKSGRAPPAGGAGGEEKNKAPAKQLSYAVVDAYVKLVLMLVRDPAVFIHEVDRCDDVFYFMFRTRFFLYFVVVFISVSWNFLGGRLFFPGSIFLLFFVSFWLNRVLWCPVVTKSREKNPVESRE